MELRQLRYFAALAGTCHFGRAAEMLHMAQPPLSQAIRRLEKELGVRLFERTTRHVALTGAGEVFRTDVENVLRAVDESVERVGRFARGAEGVLRIGFTGAASYRQLPTLARLMQKHMPGVALDVHTEMLTPAQEAGLHEGRLDVGVLRPPVRGDGLTGRALADEPLVLAHPAEHWLGAGTGTGDEPVRLERLRGEDFIVYGSGLGSVVGDAALRSCLDAGFDPHRAHEVTETSAALALVAAGLGVTLLPESIRSAPREGVLCKDVEDARHVGLSLAWRSDDDSPLLREFLYALERERFFPDAAPAYAASSAAACVSVPADASFSEESATHTYPEGRRSP
jgi:DNA-binding transcriptional LysR family regulator